ncbi:MAG: hypothetical protein ACYC1K_03270 [Minisyncoccota bacterium]
MTMVRDAITGVQEMQAGSNKAAHVVPPDQIPGSLVPYEVINLTTTRVRLDYPSGATALEFSYRQNSPSGTTAAVGRAVYIVFNATSDDDANGKLALAGARIRLPLGDDFGHLATDADPVTRVDVISEAAETGHSTLMIVARIPS